MGVADEFDEFVRAHSRSLLRTAWLLTGEQAAAEDLVQAALAHTWLRWSRLRSVDAAGAYVPRVMVTKFLGWRRRRWTGETPAAVVPEVVVPDASDAWLLRASVRRAVAALPPRQRAVIALRYLDDQSEAATAAALGCSVGTVKSQAAKALRTLRAAPGLESMTDEERV